MDDLDARMDAIVIALRPIRLRRVGEEVSYIHPHIAEALDRAGLCYEHEVRIGPRMRLDFLLDGIVIEAKRRRPDPYRLLKQLEKYTGSDQVLGVVVVAERSVPVPPEVNGKPVRFLSLDSLWGIAV